MSAVRSLRKLGRAALLGTAPRGGLPNALEHVAQAHRRHHPGADLDALSRAYVLAESSHRGQMRKSGEPYITHPLAVTLILAELGAETTTLTASLLHDTVEDTELTLDQVRAEFGEEVAYLVDGVTKLEKVDYGAAAESETFRKMLLATGNDVRVMSIKLADRLHNMRTLGVMRPEKQARIAKVTRDVLIPLAERLGVQALKTELEDLVFEILHPEEHRRTDVLIRAHREAPDPLEELAEAVRGVLREARVGAEVLIRPRHHLSVHRYRLKRGQLGPCDFGRLLILVGEEADCYAVLGELHTCFTPLISEFKDFIAVPKFNLYQSLHTAFADSSGRVAEVLVRTHRMHRVAEAGVIALGDPHRTDGADDAEADRDTDGERADPTRPGWLSRLLEWQSHAPDPDTFWAELRDDLAQDREITVFVAEPGSTADSATLHLPAGATCVDAAYARHGADGHRCVGARVDGRLTTLATVLRDGDAVQLLMAAEGGASGPSPDWLEHARTPAARLAIRRWLEAQPEEPAGGTRAPEPQAVEPAADEPPRDDREGARTESAAVAEGLPERPVRLARCCTPVPPDPVIGFAVRGGAVTAHRDGCASVARMAASGRDPVPVRWRASARASCRVTLRAEAFGRPHLLADLTETIAVQGAAVLYAAVEPPRQQRVRHTYTLRLEDAAELPALMRAMREVPGVYDVIRAAQPAL
ncbi:bifunctional (p)ppGpp synthetase/guanosine-3',5'-bis(diphosphate) 3'-pyrophosphohydrolase [Streptomyces durbertensis]|uniref:Bifunctional (P)ppGpp synthetase/guanosine-3',5'-bis(Diphosphate) 3'-pyrophosphohydrolase n=1 Tax=Streptomyces durbertensis TaxID=2448886 RepID=A0ABR6EF68_9ACTN|nr:HD domain-containing protein [Streptomyces durbertensis]MBB1243970.1 bifunctional (p)ppGpp synthetase/guanosine-3',5'-bis(diphosphate) 3'-pyrophosphohydrolase [Streptomyces durbertensis]